MTDHPAGPATARAQADASDPRASAWVSANAGSGKTYVLSRRVIRLLLAGTDPSRILCLTFTKAAAAEMAKRVFAELARWTTLSDGDLADEIGRLEGGRPDSATLADARRLFARALETPGGLKIQTIHAFCERLLHHFPFEANVAGHFEVLDGRGEAALAERARRLVFAEAANDLASPLGRAFADVLAAASETVHEAAVAEFVKKRDLVRRWIVAAGSLDGAVAQLRNALGLGAGDSYASIRALVLDEADFDAEDLARLLRLLQASDRPRDREAARRLAPCVEATSDAERIAAYIDCFTTKEGELRAAGSLATATVRDAWPELAGRLDGEIERLRGLFDRLKAAECFETTVAMLRLADGVVGAYDRLKRAEGALDFEDLIVKTAVLLQRADASRWVHCKLDRGLDHILVDEAQDTSPRQWEVIRALVEEFFAGEGATTARRTVFAVGDEKQSIFSFQGAAPAWFAKMQRDFGGRARAGAFPWRDRELHVSFRSVPAILSAVDKIFESETAHRGLSAESEKPVHEAWRRGDPGRVTLWPSIEPPAQPEPTDWAAPLDRLAAASPEIKLAERIASTIEGWLKKGERIAATGEPIRPGSILILSRTRGPHTEAINRALKTRGIPIAGADRVVLTEHIAVMDLIALGRVMLLPEDDLSLAAVLKSPLIGLDEDDLFGLAHGRSGTLWEALGRTTGGRAKEARRQLETWRARADYLDPHAFFAGILGADRGRRRFLGRLGSEAEDVLDEFLAQALVFERDGVPSLEGFLAWLGAAPTEIKRDTELLRDEVRVMTAHGAKGLEAEVVFVVDTGGAPVHSSHDARVLPLADDESGERPAPLVWTRSAKAMPSIVKARVDALRERGREEYRRLLYVALTRARDRLIVCGTQKQNVDQAGVWLGLVRNALESQSTRIEAADGTLEALEWRPEPPGPSHETAAPQRPIAAADPPAWLVRPAPPPPLLHRLAPSTAAGRDRDWAADPADRPGRVADAALLRGRLIHRLLQSLPAHPPAARREVGFRYLAAMAPDWLDEERQALLGTVMAVLDGSAFAAVFAPGSRAEVEIAGSVPVAGGSARVLGRIDRLAVTPGGVLIVDYKTNREPPDRLAAVPEDYVAQLALYARLLARLYPQKPVTAAILWTERPALMEIPSTALAASFAAITEA